jgi:hypothetical protein
MFKEVLVDIDGQRGGHDAVTLARQLVDEHAELTLGYVHGDLPLLVLTRAARASGTTHEASEFTATPTA